MSNESAEIVRMLNSAFDQVGANDNDYYPEELRAEIDELNAFIYPNVNNGVYRAGFATTQEAYEEAATGRVRGARSTSRRGSRRAATLRARGSRKPTSGYSRR